jgi:hypothetical protein
MMLRIIPLLVGLMVAGGGCARMEPYEARDEREEGPKQGLFSGPKGEFVIFTRKAEPVADNKKDKKN